MLEILQSGQATDPMFKILPWKAASTRKPIESQHTLSYAHRNIREYFSTRQQNISTLNGELRFTSSNPPTQMMDALRAWTALQDFTIFVASCQAEEKDNIGMLVKGTKFFVSS